MPVIVKIPTPLRSLTRGRDQIAVAGSSAREVLESLEREYAGLRSRICDDQGELRRFVNLYLNEEDVRHLEGLDTRVKDGDVLSIVPAIAGGDATSRDRAHPGGEKGTPS